MASHISHAALPYPIRNARFTVRVPFRVAAGTPTDPTTPDTEVSVDGGASFADLAEEITTGGSNGLGFVTLTGAETNNSAVDIAAKSANCLTTLMLLTPRILGLIGSGTLSAGSAGGGTLGTVLAYDVTGCFIRTTGGTGGGGTGGANNQARKIATYTPSTGAFTVTPNWETTPDATTTYDVLLPEGVTLGMLKTLNPATAGRQLVVDAAGLGDANTVKVGPTGTGTAQTARDLGASVLLSSGTGTGQLDFTSGVVKSNLTQMGGVAQSATDLKDFADDGYDPSTNKVQGVVLADTVTTYTGNTPQTGDTFARLGAPAGASVSADILAVDNLVDDLESRLGTPSDLGSGATVAANLVDIEAQTDDIGSAGAGLTALATAAELAKVPKSDSTVTWNATALASIQSEANDALVAYDPPTRTEATSDKDEILAAVADVPTNAELATSQAAADDATLAAIAALNNLSSADVTAAVPTAIQNADALLRRDWTLVSLIGLPGRCCLNALRFLRNAIDTSSGTQVDVTAEDDTTVVYSKVINTDPTAVQITGTGADL